MDRDSLASTFDSVAQRYERARPGYPAEMFDELAALAGLDGSARVLEIGPGTGKATRGLLRRGWSVVAVEPGAQLAAVARRVLAGHDLRVDVSPFETWHDTGYPTQRDDAGHPTRHDDGHSTQRDDGHPPRHDDGHLTWHDDRRPIWRDDEHPTRHAAGAFDLVFAATAWHWLDPTVAYRKAAGHLRPGGHLAIVSTEHVLPEPDGDPFFVDIEETYTAVGLSDGQGGPKRPDAVPAPETAGIVASGFFHEPEVRRHVWSHTYTASEYLDLLGTYSNHLRATDEQRATLFADVRRRIDARPGRTVRKHYLTVLHLARRLR